MRELLLDIWTIVNTGLWSISSQPCELGPEWKEGSVSEAGAESDLGRGTPIPQPTRRESHTEPKGGGVRVARSSIHVAKFTETLAFGHCASRWEPVKTHDSSEGVKPHSFAMWQGKPPPGDAITRQGEKPQRSKHTVSRTANFVSVWQKNKPWFSLVCKSCWNAENRPLYIPPPEGSVKKSLQFQFKKKTNNSEHRARPGRGASLQTARHELSKNRMEADWWLSLTTRSIS